MRSGTLCVLVVSLLVQATVAASPPDIVVFLADDLGIHESPLYAETSARTPEMERLADLGMTFDAAYVASPSCAPSRAAMLTGLMPARNGAQANHTHPHDGTRYLPQYLGDLGYTVAAIGKVAHGGPGGARRYGFDFVDADRWLVQNEQTYAERLDAFLSEHEDGGPLCVFVGTTSPHVPWPEESSFEPDQVVLPETLLDTPKTRARWTRYLEDVATADRQLGEIFDLARDRLGDDTLFLFSSDHGAQWPFGKWTLYEAGVRTPMIVVWPGRVAPGQRSDALVSWIDLLPTLIDAGTGQPPRSIDGRSFLPVLLGDRAFHRDRIFTTHTGDGKKNSFPTRALRVGEWKYIQNLHPEAAFTTHFDQSTARDSSVPVWREWLRVAEDDPRAAAVVDRYYGRPVEELYNLAEDPLERFNLAQQEAHADRLAEMRLAVQVWMLEQGDTVPVSSPLIPLSEPDRYRPDGPHE